LADKAITDLNVVPGSIDDNNTWFAVAQSGAAYKVSGHEFVLAMSVIWESHGGIRDIVYTDPVPPSLTGTLTITLADDTEVSFDVDNGKGITSIAKTGTVDLVDTYTITYNDGTTSTFTVTNGAKGDTGDAWYVWIRYAGEEPTQDSDIGTTPDNWMGIYSGTSSTAPVHYTDYDWFQIKGEKGDTGTAATLVSNDIQYQQSDSGSVVPSGSWSSTIPAPVAGKYLWTRTVLTFNSGSPVTFYSVARYGIDGTGAVSSVNSVSPDGNGNVSLVANDIPTAGGTSVEADLSGVKNTLSQLKQDKRKILFVGDSYGAQANNWVEAAARYLGLSSTDYINASVSGTGFTCDANGNSGENYNGFLDAIMSITNDRDSFTDVVICGGLNDSAYDTIPAFLADHIHTTISYIKSNFINAKPHIGYIGGALNSSPVLYGRNFLRRSNAKYSYMTSSRPYYLTGVENAIHESAWCYSSDGLHPSEVGGELIGAAISNAIKNGSVKIYRPMEKIDCSITGWDYAIPISFSYNNDYITISIKSEDYPSNAGNTPHSVDNPIIINLPSGYRFNNYFDCGCTCYIPVKSGSATPSGIYPVFLEFHDDIIKVGPMILSNGAWGSIIPSTIVFTQGFTVTIPSDWIN